VHRHNIIRDVTVDGKTIRFWQVAPLPPKVEQALRTSSPREWINIVLYVVGLILLVCAALKAGQGELSTLFSAPAVIVIAVSLVIAVRREKRETLRAAVIDGEFSDYLVPDSHVVYRALMAPDFVEVLEARGSDISDEDRFNLDCYLMEAIVEYQSFSKGETASAVTEEERKHSFMLKLIGLATEFSWMFNNRELLDSFEGFFEESLNNEQARHAEAKRQLIMALHKELNVARKM